MTPFELGVMLHYYAHVDDCEAFHRNPPIWDDTKNRFLSENLLELTPGAELKEAVFRITPRGRAFVEALELVPLPVQTWKVYWPDSLPLNDLRQFTKAFGM